MGNMNGFASIGPVMIGPSSSHTAGAVKLGRLARAIVGEEPQEVEIVLYGSFAKTYKGHGTDKALVAGLLDFNVDDVRIPDALEIAKQKSMHISFKKDEILPEGCHPNTVKFILKIGTKRRKIIGSSIGGGDVIVTEIDDYKKLKITGKYDTICIIHKNRPGIIRDVTAVIADFDINVNYLESITGTMGKIGYTFISVDQDLPDEIVERINSIANIDRTYLIRRL
jgi:L-serine dehydratase